MQSLIPVAYERFASCSSLNYKVSKMTIQKDWESKFFHHASFIISLINKFLFSTAFAAWSCLVSRLRHAKAGPLGVGNAARRRERREVGVRMGLPCHDGEVEGVVVEDDAVL